MIAEGMRAMAPPEPKRAAQQDATGPCPPRIARRERRRGGLAAGIDGRLILTLAARLESQRDRTLGCFPGLLSDQAHPLRRP